MRRREFITLIGGAAAVWPLAAGAQQGERVRRIGVLMNWAASEQQGQEFLISFVEGLKNLGWVEGRNLTIDRRFARIEQLQSSAADLVGSSPEVILAPNPVAV